MKSVSALRFVALANIFAGQLFITASCQGGGQDGAQNALEEHLDATAAGRILPQLSGELLDARIANLCLVRPNWPIQGEESAAEPIWDRMIPPTIVQIWLGGGLPAHASRMALWRSHAQRFGLEYHLITDADVPGMLMSAEADYIEVFDNMVLRGEYRGASDLLRYLYLRQHGGIYVDTDIRVPTFLGEEIAITSLLPMQGLVAVSDGSPVDWGVGGMHLLNGLMASCAGHPTLNALVEQLPSNIACCERAQNYYPVMQTGPAPLNLLANGPITVLPVQFWDDLSMADPEWF